MPRFFLLGKRRFLSRWRQGVNISDLWLRDALVGYVDDKKFLQGAQPARLGNRVVVWGPAQNVPGDGVWDVRVLQAPHVAS